MKKILISIIITSLGLTSCADFLDTKPYDKITQEQVWSNKNLTDGYIFQVYNDVLGNGSWLAAYAHQYSARAESATKNAMTGTLNGAYWSKDRAENMTKNDNYGWIDYALLWRYPHRNGGDHQEQSPA